MDVFDVLQVSILLILSELTVGITTIILRWFFISLFVYACKGVSKNCDYQQCQISTDCISYVSCKPIDRFLWPDTNHTFYLTAHKKE